MVCEETPDEEKDIDVSLYNYGVFQPPLNMRDTFNSNFK